MIVESGRPRRAEEAASEASVLADIAAREIARARERLVEAQAALISVDEAAGSAVAALGAVYGAHAAGADEEELERLTGRAEQCAQDVRAALADVRAELRDPWAGAEAVGP